MAPPAKVALFVPCYNVEHAVISVLERIPPDTLNRFEEVLLVDNGSQDRTRELLKEFVRSHPEKFRLFLNEENYSLGGSTIVAIRESLAREVDFLICLHSDGQADPQDLENFFPLSLDEDFVFGSRLLPGSQTAGYSRVRMLGNWFFTRLQQVILRQKIYDIGAFVAINLRTIGAYPYFGVRADMGYFPNLVLYLATQGKRLRCREFPIFWGEVLTTNVNIWAYGLNHLAQLVRMGFGLYRLTDQEAADFRSTEWRS
jgi:glycosyltransferase involved in cell wall biosynthesis